MKRKKHWVLFALLLLALIGLSPGDNRNLLSSENNRLSEPVSLPHRQEEREVGNITAAVSLNPELFERLQERTREFMESRHVQIHLINVASSEAYETFRHALALGESADVLLLDNKWVQEFAERGYLLPSEAYFSGTSSGETVEGLLALNEWNGYVWAIPKDMDPYVVVYQPDRLREFGVNSLPTNLAGWERLLSAMKANSTAKGGILGLDTTDPMAVLSLIWRIGGHPQKERDGSEGLTEGENQALRVMDKARSVFYSTPDTLARDNFWTQLSTGQAVLGIYRASELHNRPFSTSLKIEYPGLLNPEHRMYAAGKSFAVAASSSEGETANEWIAAMTSAEMQADWFDISGELPALKSAYSSSFHPGLKEWISAKSQQEPAFFIPSNSAQNTELENFSVSASAFMNGQLPLKAFSDAYAKITQARP
ncbi:ABC transporter substrate-binding protein [Paenibacillus sp. CAA11]|uniref:ABC transporter substrate-binding protein n=1 Tax=Paenibacillus sp. CAA11 TaxID=1532905 RepID=UPI00131F0341|nr:extracellular solute-binding protein [Paenibacillus sp. CAA11]